MLGFFVFAFAFVAVRLTAKGLRQRARARKAIQAVESRLKRQLGPRRFEVFRTTLEELVEPGE